jgi:hypothetical protein
MAKFDDRVTDRNLTRASVEAFVADQERIGMLHRDELFACTSSGTTGYRGLFLHMTSSTAQFDAHHHPDGLGEARASASPTGSEERPR